MCTPINNSAYGSLDPKTAQQASGLINLARQLGGSFGIAALSTFVDKHTQLHRVDLVQNIYAGNPALVERQRMLTSGFIAHGYSPLQAAHAAMGAIDQIVMRQAAMLSYNDAWMLIMMAFVVASPAIFLLRKPKGKPASAEMH